MKKTPRLYVPLLSCRGGGCHHLLLSNLALYPNQLNINKGFNLGPSLLGRWGGTGISVWGRPWELLCQQVDGQEKTNERPFTFCYWL